VTSTYSPEEVVWEALLAAEEAEPDGLIMESDDEGSARLFFLRSGRLEGCRGLGLLPVDKLAAKDNADSNATALANLMVGNAHDKRLVRRALGYVWSLLSTADRTAPLVFCGSLSVDLHPPTTLS
jgi:hypothetical protein